MKLVSIVLVILMIFAIYLVCTSRSHAYASNDFFGSLSFKITLFSNDGSVIEKWENCSRGNSLSGGGYSFKSAGDKMMLISGTYIVEQE